MELSTYNVRGRVQLHLQGRPGVEILTIKTLVKARDTTDAKAQALQRHMSEEQAKNLREARWISARVSLVNDPENDKALAPDQVMEAMDCNPLPGMEDIFG